MFLALFFSVGNVSIDPRSVVFSFIMTDFFTNNFPYEICKLITCHCSIQQALFIFEMNAKVFYAINFLLLFYICSLQWFNTVRTQVWIFHLSLNLYEVGRIFFLRTCLYHRDVVLAQKMRHPQHEEVRPRQLYMHVRMHNRSIQLPS